MQDDTERRAIAAAAEYLKRIGWAEVSVREEHGAVDITGLDDAETVAVIVTVSNSAASPPPTAMNRESSTGYDRLDHIDILVIAADRALLRHQRAAQ